MSQSYEGPRDERQTAGGDGAGAQAGGGRATPPRSAPAPDTRADLIEAGRALFAERGFDGTSVRAITERAGANLGAITYHFGSKRALYEAVLEEALGPLSGRVAEVGRSGGSARTRLTRIVDTYFEHFEAHPDAPRLLLQEVAAGKEPPPVVGRIIGLVLGTLLALQEEGRRDGTVRDADPVFTALSVIAQPIYMTLVGPMLKAFRGIDLLDAGTRQAAMRHASRFVDAGLRPDATREEGAGGSAHPSPGVAHPHEDARRVAGREEEEDR